MLLQFSYVLIKDLLAIVIIPDRTVEGKHPQKVQVLIESMENSFTAKLEYKVIRKAQFKQFSSNTSTHCCSPQGVCTVPRLKMKLSPEKENKNITKYPSS